MPKCINCNKQAKFNLPTEKTGLTCCEHKQQNFIDITRKKCLEENCNTRAIDEKTGLYCKKHAKKDMIDVINKKCIYNNCKICNYVGQKCGLYCTKHKLENMCIVTLKKCKYKVCNTIPVYNYIGQTVGLYCSKHKLENMIDVKSKQCIYENCTKISIYNYPNTKIGLYCKEHALDGMKDVKNKKCLECDKQPRFNFPQEKTGLYCSIHKKNNMIDIYEKLCKNKCGSYASKHKDYCMRCFIYLFPNENTSKNFKIKEKHVTDYIVNEFPTYKWTMDKIINNGCSKRRPDAYSDLLTHVLIVECDEDQHKDYEKLCDNKRTMEIFQDFGNRPIVFIRFNPDKYINSLGI